MHEPPASKHFRLNQKRTVILSSCSSVRFEATDSWQYRVDRNLCSVFSLPWLLTDTVRVKLQEYFIDHESYPRHTNFVFFTVSLHPSPCHLLPQLFPLPFLLPVTLLLLSFPRHHRSPSTCRHYLRLCCSHYRLPFSLYATGGGGYVEYWLHKIRQTSQVDCV